MSFKKTLVLLPLLVGISLCAYEEEQKYYKRPPPPRILSHKQAQNHDGGFKFHYAAENGLAHTEVIAPDGSRNGGYTYVDPHGKTISVKYRAGKDGFQILEGDHVPRDPNNPPIHQQQQQQPSYQPVPHYARQESPDDGSYKPERYEKPTSYERPAFHAPTGKQPQGLGAYHQPQPRYVYQERPSAYPTTYKQPQFAAPQKSFYQNPIPSRLYEPNSSPGLDTTASNSVEQPEQNEQEKKEPDYHDEPGKPYSFGAGYAFQFGS